MNSCISSFKNKINFNIILRKFEKKSLKNYKKFLYDALIKVTKSHYLNQKN
jgi:hypothetical protein